MSTNRRRIWAVSEPRGLDDAEREAWKALLGVAILLPGALDTQLRRMAGITSFDYLVLAMLADAPSRTLRMSKLAHCTNSSLSRLSHVVARLETRDWVRRHACPEDGRVTLATLTDAGWDECVRLTPGHVAAVRALVFDALTEEDVEDLRRVGAKILDRLDPDSPFPRR
jgi:DNA-binding MarR family transcriptional regulator